MKGIYNFMMAERFALKYLNDSKKYGKDEVLLLDNMFHGLEQAAIVGST